MAVAAGDVFFDFKARPTYQCRHGKGPRNTPDLADLRKEIDRIDEAMHGLLMERGEIIDRLIAVKKSQECRLGIPARRARPR